MTLSSSWSRVLAVVLGWALIAALLTAGPPAHAAGDGGQHVGRDAPAAASVEELVRPAVAEADLPPMPRQDADEQGAEQEAASLLDGLPGGLVDETAGGGAETTSAGEADAGPADEVDPTTAVHRAVPEQVGTHPAVREALAGSEDGTVGVIIRVTGSADLAQLEVAADRAALEAGRRARGTMSEGQAAQAADEARAETVVETLAAAGADERAAVLDLLNERAGEATHGPAATAGTVGEPVDLWAVNSVGAWVDEATLEALERRDEVVSIRLEEQVELPETTSEPALPSWSLEKVQAPQTWGEYGHRGEGITVAVLDTGVDGGHPALAGQYRGRDGDDSDSWFVATGENYPEPGDGNGHGTHVTGSVLGGSPGDIIGVAPDAEWIGVKLLNDGGRGGEIGILNGMQWIMAPGGDPAKAPDIASNSWGSAAGDNRTFWDVVTAWRAAGILPVFANGNDGPVTGTVGNPGGYPHSLGVGATDSDDLIAPFSSRGPAVWDGVEYTKPQVSAPGAEIRSAWPLDLSEDGYHTISGTSMATPHVSGVAALVLSAAPGMGVDELQEVLEETARQESHMGTLPNNSYGYGIVDAYAATTRAAHSGLVSGQVTGPDGPVEATLEVVDTDPLISTTSDGETGDYELYVTSGSHTVEVSAFGYRTQSVAIEVVAGEPQVLDVALEAQDGATLTGTVTADGEPVPGAAVRVAGRPQDTAYTSADGNYQLPLPEGTHQLQARAGGYRAWSGEVTVEGDTTADVELEALPETGAGAWTQLKAVPAGTGLADSAVDAASLAQQWSAKVSQVMFGSPVVSGDSVYIASVAGGITAIDRTDGSLRWTVDTGSEQRGTPAVSADGETVYATTGRDGSLVALSAADGSEQWSYSTGSDLPVYGSPTLVEDAVLVAVGSDTTGGVHAVDATTGEGLWRTDIGAGVFFGPAVADGVAVAGSTATATVSAMDVESGEILWQRPETITITLPAITGGTVFLGTSNAEFTGGSVLALDLATGETLWEVTDHGDTQGSSPVLYDDLVILGTHSGGAVAAYDQTDGTRVWHHYVGTAVTSSVAVTSGGVVLGGAQDQSIFALDATSGDKLWEDQLPAPILSSAAVAGETAVFVSRDGTVAAYESSGQVTGTVSGPDGPVAAEIQLTGLKEYGETADPDTGTYQFSVPTGDYAARISHYGLSTHTEDITVTPHAPVVIDATLTPVGNGTVAGVVRDEAGDPLPGATVALADVPLDPVTTTDDGTFAFDAVAEGEWELTVDLPGKAPYAEPVSVTTGETTTVEVTLGSFDVAVVADYRSRLADVLRAQGWSVDEISFAEAAEAAGEYQVLVLNGGSDDRSDTDLERLAATLTAADQAGTSIVALDTWGATTGSVGSVLTARGSEGTVVSQSTNRGAVWLSDPVEHPITAPIDQDRFPILRSSYHAWIEGYEGASLATLGNDALGPRGTGIGYDRTGPDSVQVLLPSQASSALVGPDETWTAGAEEVFVASVQHAVDAEFGTVNLTVTGPDGPVDGTVTVVDSFEQETITEGSGSILLDPGTHTLRVRSAGLQTAEQEVTVSAGEVTPAEFELAPSGAGSISGVVTDAAGQDPIAGAVVTLPEVEGVEATTGADGGYLLDDLPAGSYTLHVEADGYLTVDVPDVVVTEGATTTTDVALDGAPQVAIIGDYDSQLINLLTEAQIPAVEGGWELVEDLSDTDVVVLNSAPKVTAPEFRDHLAALDAAGVSVLFTASNTETRTPPIYQLSETTGSPSDVVDHGGFGDGPVALTSMADHPIFGGLAEEPVIYLNAAADAPVLEGYQGVALADVGIDGDVGGTGIAYDVRTPDSVHVILSGLYSGVSSDPHEDWAAEGRTVFINAIRFAGAPHLTQLSGTVTDPDGHAVAAAEVTVAGQTWSATTDDAGDYLLGLPEGEHTVVVTAHGYEPVEQVVSVDGPTETLDVELALGDVGTLSGIVYGIDGSGTGIDAASPQADAAGTLAEGTPLPDAEVRLSGTQLATTTDDQGRFTLPRVESGDRELEVEVDGHVRTLHTFTMTSGEHTEDVTILESPTVGVVGDSASGTTAGRTLEFLADWGYDGVEVDWTDAEAIAGVDLVVLNNGTGSNPGAAVFETFLDTVNRGDIPVVWLGNYSRGGIRNLTQHLGDPAELAEGTLDGAVTTTVTEPGHPLVAGLPETFAPTETGRMYSGFTGYSGTTVATVASEDGPAGDSVAFDGRTAGSVDVLVSTVANSNYGAVGTRTSDPLYFTPENTRLLVNALDFGMRTTGIGADTRGTVVDASGDGVEATVTVEETGRVYPARSGDGGYVIPLDPGTYTLTARAFGYAPASTEVTIEEGTSVTSQITLGQAPGAGVAGTVTDAGGAPVEGAVVDVDGTELTATTGADGHYSVAHIPEGDWTLIARADGQRTRFADVTVVDGTPVSQDLQLGAAAHVAVVGDRTDGSMASFLTGNGFSEESFGYAALGDVDVTTGEFDLVLVNGNSTAPPEEVFTSFLEDAAAYDVPVVFGSQFNGGGIRQLVSYLGDPESQRNSFEPDEIGYRVDVDHPIFDGYQVGDTLTLLSKPGQNQQFASFDGYSGTVLGETVAPLTGKELGSGVAYRFASPGSVHLLLGSLAANSYGAPGANWTTDGERIMLNGLDWALQARQSNVHGVVTSGGEPVEGAAVEVGGRSGTTDSEGAYRIGVAPGEHTLEVTAEGHEPFSQDVTVGIEESVEVDVELVPLAGSALTVVVTEPDGAPVAGATVAVAGPTDGEETTGEDGHAVFDPVLVGDYDVTVSSPHHVGVDAEVTVGPDAATLEVEVQPIEVGVLGDVDGDLTAYLLEEGLPADEVDWETAVADVDAYEALVVNGGQPSEAQFTGLLDAADESGVSLVFTGTYGVTEGGIRLLEAHSEEVVVGGHGYRDGTVGLTDLAEHPVVAGVADPEHIVADDGYYSWLSEYPGEQLATLTVGGEPGGAAATFDQRTADSGHLLLSFAAVSDYMGPDRGWTEDTGTVVVDSLEWLLDLEAVEPPEVPTLTTEETLVAQGPVEIFGEAPGADEVSVLRGEDLLGTVAPEDDGTYALSVELVEGPNVLVARASNSGGTADSEPLEVVLDSSAPQVTWTPEAGSGYLDPEVLVEGTVTDEYAEPVTLTVQGEEVDVAEDGTFAMTVPLAEGSNTITLVATDALGNEVTEEREVGHVLLTAEWQTPGRGGQVILTLRDDSGDPTPVDGALLQLLADDEVAAEFPMEHRGQRYFAQVRDVEPGTYGLVAVLEVEGWTVETGGPDLQVR